MPKDVDEQIKLAHKAVHIVYRSNRKTCLRLLRYNVDEPEILYAQFRIIVRRKENEKNQRVAYVDC